MVIVIGTHLSYRDSSVAVRSALDGCRTQSDTTDLTLEIGENLPPDRFIAVARDFLVTSRKLARRERPTRNPCDGSFAFVRGARFLECIQRQQLKLKRRVTSMLAQSTEFAV